MLVSLLIQLKSLHLTFVLYLMFFSLLSVRALCSIHDGSHHGALRISSNYFVAKKSNYE